MVAARAGPDQGAHVASATAGRGDRHARARYAYACATSTIAPDALSSAAAAAGPCRRRGDRGARKRITPPI